MSEKTPCWGMDPELFFPLDEDGPGAAPALAACAACPVRAQCLDIALTMPVAGIWGGTSTALRRAMRRRGQREMGRPEAMTWPVLAALEGPLTVRWEGREAVRW